MLLPAPFSPSRAWISPGWTTRSIASLATSGPKRLVIPRSSSFSVTSRTGSSNTVRTSLRGARWCSPSGCYITSAASLRLAGRGDRDLAGDDVRLDLLELALEAGRHLALELVEGRQPGTVVLEVTDVAAGRERASGRAVAYWVTESVRFLVTLDRKNLQYCAALAQPSVSTHRTLTLPPEAWSRRARAQARCHRQPGR